MKQEKYQYVAKPKSMAAVVTVLFYLLTALTATITVFVFIPPAWGFFLDLCYNGVRRADGTALKTYRNPKFPTGNIFHERKAPLADVDALIACAKAQDGVALSWFFRRPLVICLRTDVIREILGPEITLRASTRLLGKTFPIWDRLFGNGLFMVGPDKWRRQHRIAVRGLGSRVVKAQTPLVMKIARETVSELRKAVQSSSVPAELELIHHFQTYALKAIVAIAFGSDTLPADTQERVRVAFTRVTKNATSLLFLLSRMAIHAPTSTARQIKQDIQFLQRVGADIVTAVRGGSEQPKKSDPKEEKSGGGGVEGSLLHALCTARDEDAQLSDSEVVHNVYSFMFAGLDTVRIYVDAAICAPNPNPNPNPNPHSKPTHIGRASLHRLRLRFNMYV